jgi:TPP-dependent pyruvate/acetoin dehydrogenase alpha subunit
LGVTDAELDSVSAAARREMHDAREAARMAPWPDVATLLDDVQDIGAPTWRA